jgi:hypothetical protein
MKPTTERGQRTRFFFLFDRRHQPLTPASHKTAKNVVVLLRVCDGPTRYTQQRKSRQRPRQKNEMVLFSKSRKQSSGIYHVNSYY